MRFPDPLMRGTLVRRYKRFLADVRLEDGTAVTAHCANSGSMLSVHAPGSEVWLSPARNPNRKLRYTWELIRVGDTLVGINTGHPNRLVEDAIGAGTIDAFTAYETIRREVRYGQNSRIDLLLEGAGLPTCFVEVKNVSMKRDTAADAPAEFPDAVTSRGAKHLRELSAMVAEGHRAAMVYLVQRGDCRRFSVAADIDPTYASFLTDAMAAGVEVYCYGCAVSTEAIIVTGALALDFRARHGSPVV